MVQKKRHLVTTYGANAFTEQGRRTGRGDGLPRVSLDLNLLFPGPVCNGVVALVGGRIGDSVCWRRVGMSMSMLLDCRSSDLLETGNWVRLALGLAGSE